MIGLATDTTPHASMHSPSNGLLPWLHNSGGTQANITQRFSNIGNCNFTRDLKTGFPLL